MAVVKALEELVGSRAEAVPHLFRLVAADRADGLPLLLQPLHLVGGDVPVRRFGQRFGARAERFLLRLILRPDLLARGQVFAAAREERA